MVEGGLIGGCRASGYSDGSVTGLAMCDYV